MRENVAHAQCAAGKKNAARVVTDSGKGANGGRGYWQWGEDMVREAGSFWSYESMSVISKDAVCTTVLFVIF